ncbi:hypothetical protein G7Y89_g7012 [Cudoniella acicularis]|uniref:DUF7708 domain-containing protein n=1 Tax=Cudoniella acicularis TaxID=354080 RepID=A0A8H4RKX0_9HELO|nr:hypothetical protein G7Y89_g7012 [Cudoniella acicularis]
MNDQTNSPSTLWVPTHLESQGYNTYVDANSATRRQLLTDFWKKQEECAKAIDNLQRELRSIPAGQNILLSVTSVQDFKVVLADQFKEDMTSSLSSKGIAKSSIPRRDAQRWLGRFSSEVEFYAQILDIIAGVDTKTVTLVWGAIIVILRVIINRTDLVIQFCETLCKIGSALPRFDPSTLYPTMAMTSYTFEIYLSLISFLIGAVHWCNSSLRHPFRSSIFKPLKLDDEATVERIISLSRALKHETHAQLNSRVQSQTDQLRKLLMEREERTTVDLVQAGSLYKPLASTVYEIRLLALRPPTSDCWDGRDNPAMETCYFPIA